MSDTTLIQRLHDASQGHDEWRVQSPADGAYCIAFAWPESLDPECEARSWLSDHIKQFPNGRFVDYVVACVRVTSEADQLRIEAADALKQQAAQIEHLKLAEEGAKTAFFHVVQDKDDIAAECKRTHELLHSAHDIIRRDAAKIEAKDHQLRAAKTIIAGLEEQALHQSREFALLKTASADVAGEREANALLTSEVEALRAALEKIEAWHTALPPTGKFHSDGSEMSFGWCFGSNGEREIMREIARAALRQEQPKPLVEIGRRTTPCGECHLQPGECCDICGARDVSAQPAGKGEK